MTDSVELFRWIVSVFGLGFIAGVLGGLVLAVFVTRITDRTAPKG